MIDYDPNNYNMIQEIAAYMSSQKRNWMNTLWTIEPTAVNLTISSDSINQTKYYAYQVYHYEINNKELAKLTIKAYCTVYKDEEQTRIDFEFVDKNEQTMYLKKNITLEGFKILFDPQKLLTPDIIGKLKVDYWS